MNLESTSCPCAYTCVCMHMSANIMEARKSLVRALCQTPPTVCGPTVNIKEPEAVSTPHKRHGWAMVKGPAGTRGSSKVANLSVGGIGQRIWEKLGKHHPDHAACCEAESEGKQGTKTVDEEIRWDGHKRLGEGCQQGPQHGLPHGDALSHQNCCDCQPLRNVVQSNR